MHEAEVVHAPRVLVLSCLRSAAIPIKDSLVWSRAGMPLSLTMKDLTPVSLAAGNTAGSVPLYRYSPAARGLPGLR